MKRRRWFCEALSLGMTAIDGLEVLLIQVLRQFRLMTGRDMPPDLCRERPRSAGPGAFRSTFAPGASRRLLARPGCSYVADANRTSTVNTMLNLDLTPDQQELTNQFARLARENFAPRAAH